MVSLWFNYIAHKTQCQYFLRFRKVAYEASFFLNCPPEGHLRNLSYDSTKKYRKIQTEVI